MRRSLDVTVISRKKCLTNYITCSGFALNCIDFNVLQDRGRVWKFKPSYRTFLFLYTVDLFNTVFQKITFLQSLQCGQRRGTWKNINFEAAKFWSQFANIVENTVFKNQGHFAGVCTRTYHAMQYLILDIERWWFRKIPRWNKRKVSIREKMERSRKGELGRIRRGKSWKSPQEMLRFV